MKKHKQGKNEALNGIVMTFLLWSLLVVAIIPSSMELLLLQSPKIHEVLGSNQPRQIHWHWAIVSCHQLLQLVLPNVEKWIIPWPNMV